MGHLSRSIFPVAALSLSGKGLKIGVVGLGFWCLAGLAILACVVSGWISEGSNGKEIILEDDDEEDVQPDGAEMVEIKRDRDDSNTSKGKVLSDLVCLAILRRHT
jgi:hypothetical protein